MDAVGGQVGSEGEEGDADRSKGSSFSCLVRLAVTGGLQPVKHEHGGDGLDARVQPEAGERQRGAALTSLMTAAPVSMVFQAMVSLPRGAPLPGRRPGWGQRSRVGGVLVIEMAGRFQLEGAVLDVEVARQAGG